MNDLFDNFPTEDELLTIIMHTSNTIWDNDLVEKDIKRWLNNFTGEVLPIERERLLGLWLLSHFTFYNKNEVTHLCKVLYRDLLHLIVTSPKNIGKEPDEVINTFWKKSTIISPGKTSDSGGFIAYFFRLENDLPYKLFSFSKLNISEKTENLLVIDDVTLTADHDSQASQFFSTAKRTFPDKTFYLLTLIANEQSINYLNEQYGVKVICPIILDERDKCFNINSDIFCSYPDLIPICKNFVEHYGQKLFPDHPLGYKDGQFTFGFFYNTPDNSLPIFWVNKNDWHPVIRRYHKNYFSEKYLTDERFI